jgi:2-polyprenyl-3-methyl-5-hydroxy-6-metoxy-1,4-benzoquinol methylase
MNWRAFWNDSPQLRSADFCRQVGRTLHNVPYSADDIERVAVRLLTLLEPGSDHTLLDLACGNGLITSRLAPRFATVTAIDCSHALIATANQHFSRPNLQYRVGDVLDVGAVSAPYDRVLLSAAFQYLEPAEGRQLLQRLNGVVRPDGCVVLGDVPDRDRLWSFYGGLRGKWRFALDAIRDTPIIGCWWRPSALRRLAEQTGWSASTYYQPPDLPNHYFRYDVVLRPDLKRRG